MAKAGNVILCNVWDYNYDSPNSDDEVGGSVPSGTVIYRSTRCRIHSMRPTQALLEQGIEDISMYTAIFMDHTIDIENNNEIEVVAPPNSPYYGEFFRCVGNPQRTSTHPSDSRSHIMVTVKRIERSRALQ